MKRLLLIVLCLLMFPWTPCQSAEPIQLARMNPWVAGAVTASAGTCTESTPESDNAEIGTLSVGGTGQESTTARIYCELMSPDCNGTLGTAYVYGVHASQTAPVKVSVYETTDNSGGPTVGDLTGSSGAISFTSTPAWQSAVTSGGAVDTSKKYWVCWHTSSDYAVTTYHSGAGNTRYYVTSAGQYTNIPSKLPVAGDCTGSGAPYGCCTGDGAGCSWNGIPSRQTSVFVGVK